MHPCEIPALRNLAQAEHWYLRSLELHDERDRLGRGKCTIVLGTVNREHFKEARTANKPANELTYYLTTALDYYHKALDLLPPNAVDDLAVVHNQLGLCYQDGGDLDRALYHYREDIRYDEAAGNVYGAAQTRFNVAIGLLNAGRLPDALEYAQAALRGFETYGDRAAADIQDTQGLIERIQKRMSQ